MSPLKRLIVEIHRRSLWQVLLIYVGGAWICYEIIDTITDRLTLPGWLPVLAIVLFLIGLPIVVATAFIREDAVSPSATAAAEAVPLGSRVEAARPRPHVTWRNSGLIFVFALALWGVVAAGGLVFGGAGETPTAAEERPSVAVLPLQAPSLFGTGLTGGGSSFLAHLGRFDEALAALERAYAAREPRLEFVNAHPLYEGLRSDPRFQDLLRRMNFPD